MADERDVQALLSAVKALTDRVAALENMIGGPTKKLEAGGNALVIGSQGVEIVSGGNLLLSVGGDCLLKVQRTASIQAQGDYQVTAGRNANITVGGTMTETVGAQHSMTVGAQASITVGGNILTAAGGSVQTTAGMDTVIVAGKDIRINANRNLQTEVRQDAEMTFKSRLAIQAGDDLTLKTGAASIAAKKDGNVTIKGKDITFDASGNLNAKGSKDMVLKGKNILQN
jgi:type VI secretion system secreted protein VgrG